MKEKLVEQSIQLFEKKGFSETSIQEIVDTLGVTKGTFYYHFNSKEQLLMDIHLMYINDLLDHQQRIMADPAKDYKQKLLDCVQLIMKRIKSNGQEANVFFREMRNLQGENLQQIKTMRDQFRYNLQKMIELGIDHGEFRNDLRPDMVTFGILGMCNWSYQWFDPNGSVPEDELIKTYIEVLLQGIQSKN